MLGGLERGTLDFVRVHRGERRVIELAGANPDHALDRLHEDLAVADFAGARGRQDGLDARLHKWLRADHLDLHLFLEFHDDGGAAILLDDLLLAPWPLTRVSVIPVTPARNSAALTSGRRSGRTIVVMSFMGRS